MFLQFVAIIFLGTLNSRCVDAADGRNPQYDLRRTSRQPQQQDFGKVSASRIGEGEVYDDVPLVPPTLTSRRNYVDICVATQDKFEGILKVKFEANPMPHAVYWMINPDLKKPASLEKDVIIATYVHHLSFSS